MSARRAPVRFSGRARRDISDILLHTHERWGSAKRSEYRQVLDKAIAELNMFPELGRTRDDISPGLRAFPVGRHIVFYRLRGSQLFVTRVFHAQRETSLEDLDED